MLVGVTAQVPRDEPAGSEFTLTVSRRHEDHESGELALLHLFELIRNQFVVWSWLIRR